MLEIIPYTPKAYKRRKAVEKNTLARANNDK